MVGFMSSSSSLCSSSFPFQSNEFSSSTISNRLAQAVWNDDWTRTICLDLELVDEMISKLEDMKQPKVFLPIPRTCKSKMKEDI